MANLEMGYDIKLTIDKYKSALNTFPDDDPLKGQCSGPLLSRIQGPLPQST